MQQLASFDYIVFLIYFVIVASYGYWIYNRKKKAQIDSKDFFLAEGRHYITIIIIADWQVGQPELRESHKCEQWAWFEWNQLPEPLFPTFGNLAKAGIELKHYW